MDFFGVKNENKRKDLLHPVVTAAVPGMYYCMYNKYLEIEQFQQFQLLDTSQSTVLSSQTSTFFLFLLIDTINNMNDSPLSRSHKPPQNR